MPTILSVLSGKNPDILSKVTGRGLSSIPSWSQVSSITNWVDFNYETLILCYGDILQLEWPEESSDIRPQLTNLEREFWDEDGLTKIQARTILPITTQALVQAYKSLYVEKILPIEIRTGGYAKPRAYENDPRLYPDWAGIRPDRKQADGERYYNLCPGETKVSAKWKYANNEEVDWILPFRQIQTYCGVQWKERYGYILTDEELMVVRASKEIISPGLATTRSPRAIPSAQFSHTRNISGLSNISSLSSGLSAMSISDPSYHDDESGIEFGPLEVCSIPYSAHGMNVMTVKLALWWIHMMASAPNTSASLENQYYPLHSCIRVDKGYLHLTTGQVTKYVPEKAVIIRSDPSQLTSVSRSQPRSNMMTFYVEDIKKAEWDTERNRWNIALRNGDIFVIGETTPIPRRSDNVQLCLVRDSAGRSKSVLYKP